MKNKYDYIIIGAGPSGLFSAYALSKKYNTKNILILDKGYSYEKRKCPILQSQNICNCKTCSILSGIGGSAFYIPAKLSNYPAGSKLLSMFKDEQECKFIYLEVLNAFKEYGLNILPPGAESTYVNNYQKFAKKLNRDIYLKYYNSQEFSRDNFSDFIHNLQSYLYSVGVEIVPETEIIGLKKEKGLFVLNDNQENIIYTDKIVVATGETGAFWWHDISEKMNVIKKTSSIDVGIRIEFPSDIIKNIYSFHKDPKFIFEAPDGSELRSYCTLSNGEVVICRNGDFRVVDGISCSHDNGIGSMTIFNRIYPEVYNAIDYAKILSDIVYKKCNGKIAVSTIGELLEGEVIKNIKTQTLHYTENIQLSKVTPSQVLENLRYGIKRLAEVIKGIDIPTNIVYYPAIDKLWAELVLKQNFETSVDGLYVVGDATGIARGIFQAALMGYVCGTKI